MEMEMKDDLGLTVERLAATAGMLEQAVERLEQRQNAFAQDAEATIGRIVATVDGRQESELERKLEEAEAEIAVLRAAGASATAAVTYGRKTLPASMVSLVAKRGGTAESIDAGALDAALASLSMEQRFAVKAQLLRAGLLG
jgi:hypothetical protein